jgi:hypothetical protein
MMGNEGASWSSSFTFGNRRRRIRGWFLNRTLFNLKTMKQPIDLPVGVGVMRLFHRFLPLRIMVKAGTSKGGAREEGLGRNFLLLVNPC